MANKKDLRNKFINAADRRVERVLLDLECIGRLANRKNYSYTDDDARRMFERINEELNCQARKFFLKNKFTLKRKGDL